MLTPTVVAAQPRLGCWWDCAGPNNTPPCIQKCPEHLWRDARRAWRVHGDRHRYYGWHHGRPLRGALGGVPEIALGAVAIAVLTFGTLGIAATRAADRKRK